ncbi:hypothetical protein BC833DRAFT_633200 [Globomyces pollinis-pini]|nr:hypothetical protein BC833DRAFT_633200 [Globomyces pollinis-pini]
MSVLKEQLSKWCIALKSYESGNVELAYVQFQEFADTSKIHFNVGMLGMQLKDTELAIESFSRAIDCDPYLAVAYYQRGVLLYYNNEVDLALENFQDAYERLRDNTHINYTQLGLEHFLFAAHILFNLSLCFFCLGDDERGFRYMKNAAEIAGQTKDDGQKIDSINILDAQRMDPADICQILLYEVPEKTLFKPSEDNVKNLENVNYLGKAKVVAAEKAEDGFDGFSGRKVKEMTLGRGYRKKAELERQATKGPLLPTAIPETFERQATLTRKPPPAAAISENGDVPRFSPRKSSITSLSDDAPSPFSRISSKITPRTSSANYKNSPNFIDLKSVDSANDTIGRLTPTGRLDARGYAALTPTSEAGSSNSLVPDNMIRVKALFKDTRMVLVPDDVNYNELLAAVRKKFNNQALLVKFIDETGRKTVMGNDDDLDEAIDVSPNPAKLEVWCFVPL